MRGICFALAALLTSSAASAAVYVTLAEVPDGNRTTAVGINGKNQIAGHYFDAGGHEHAFFGPINGPYTSFDVGTTRTWATGINNAGTIVGSTNSPEDGGFNLGFERYPSGKTVIVRMGHSEILDGGPGNINNLGVFVGAGNVNPGFVEHTYYARKGRYTGEMVVSQSTLPTPASINASNVVVGYFFTNEEHYNYVHHGFILSGGVSTQIDYPDDRAVYGTELNGINDDGLIAGDWLDLHHRRHAFKYDMNTADFTPLQPPGTPYANAWQVNEKGLIAMTSDIGSFVYCPNVQRCPASGTVVADAPSVRAKPRR